MATDTHSDRFAGPGRLGRVLDYRLLVLVLLFVYGFLDTVTTHAMYRLGAHDSHPVILWLIDAGMVEFWAFKLAWTAFFGVLLLGAEPYMVDPDHPRVTLAIKALLALAVVLTLLLGPLSHAWVWAANGYPGVV